MGTGKIDMEPLFQSRSMRVRKKTYLCVTVCHAYKWIERHPCSCTVWTIPSVTVSANSWSCHQSTQCLSGFHRMQLKGYFALTAFFFSFFRSLQTSFHVFFFFPFLTFYCRDFIRNWNFHDHQVLGISMGFELLSHLNTLNK